MIYVLTRLVVLGKCCSRTAETKNTTLEELLMWNNKIGCDGCDTIDRCLVANKTLITLDLAKIDLVTTVSLS